MRFRAEVGAVNLVGFDRLNPQLQEQVIPTHLGPKKPARQAVEARPGRPGRRPRNQSARPWEK